MGQDGFPIWRNLLSGLGVGWCCVGFNRPPASLGAPGPLSPSLVDHVPQPVSLPSSPAFASGRLLPPFPCPSSSHQLHLLNAVPWSRSPPHPTFFHPPHFTSLAVTTLGISRSHARGYYAHLGSRRLLSLYSCSPYLRSSNLTSYPLRKRIRNSRLS